MQPLDTCYFNLAKMGILAKYGNLSFSDATTFTIPPGEPSLEHLFLNLKNIFNGDSTTVLQTFQNLQTIYPELIIAETYIDVFLNVNADFSDLPNTALIYVIVKRIQKGQEVTDIMKRFLNKNLFVLPDHKLYKYLVLLNKDLIDWSSLVNEESNLVTEKDLFPDVYPNEKYVLETDLITLLEKTAFQVGVESPVENISSRLSWYKELLNTH